MKVYILLYRQFIVALLLVLAAFAAKAQTTTWTGGVSSDWNTAGNWNNGVPTATSTVIINACTTCPLLPSGTTHIGRLTLNGRIDTDASSGTLTLNTDQGANTIGATGVLGTAGQPGTFTTLGTITAQLTINAGATVNMNIANFRLGGESRFNGATFNDAVTLTDFGGFGTWRGLRAIGNTFNGVVNATNSITVAGGNGNNFGFSGNTFNADVTITCNSTQADVLIGVTASWFPAASSPRDVFNANLTIHSTTTNERAINVEGGAVPNQVAGNFVVNVAGGFGQITINNLEVTGASIFNLTNMTSGQGVQIAQGASQATTFHGNVTISNTGSTINQIFRCANSGNVTFNGNLTINSTGGASGERAIRIGDGIGNPGTVTLAADRTITATAAVGSLNINKLTQASGLNNHTHTIGITDAAQLNMSNIVLFGNTNFTATNVTSGEGIRIAQDPNRTAVFHGNVTINNTGSTVNEIFRCANSGNVTFNGNITVSSTGGASGARRIRIADNETTAGTVTLAADRTITATGVQVGELHINKITQASGTNTHTHNLSLPATVPLFVQRNTLHGNLTATGDRMRFRRNTIGSSAANTHVISHTGMTNETETGGNTFKGAVTLNFEKNLPAGDNRSWVWGWNDANNNGGADIFENDVTVNVDVNGVPASSGGSGGLVAFANSAGATTEFNKLSGQTIFNLKNTTSAIHLARNPNTSVIVHGNFTATAEATNNGNLTWDNNTRGALQIAFGAGSVVTFKKDVVMNNQSTTDLACCGRNQFSLAASGTIHFEGNVTFNGSGLSAYNFANTTQAAPATRGLLIFREGLAQTISTNIANLNLARVQINKTANNVTLANNSIRIANELILTARHLELGDHDLLLHSAAATPVNATITGGSANSYIIATGAGRAFRRVEAANTLFPVGTASAYMPFTINNAGAADQFGVRMADLSAAPYNISSYFVNHGWDVVEGAAGGSNNAITGQWNASNEQTNFNRAQSAFYRWNGTQFNCLQPEAAATGAGPYTRSVSALGATNSVGVFALATAFADADISATNVKNVTSCGGFNLSANVNPFTGPGQWSQVSGPTTVTFTDPASPTSLVSGMVTGTYVLRWTTAQGCTNRTSDVTINFTQTSLTPVANCVWTGDANNGNWNDCSNWTGSVPGEVTPGVWSNVTIPGGLTTMYPVLAANVTVGGFTMTAGASINLANFTLEARGATAVAGSTITANGGVLNKTSTSDDTWAGGNTFSGNLTIRHSGAGGTLSIAGTSGNTFQQNITFDIAHASANILPSASGTTNFFGNVTVSSVAPADITFGGTVNFSATAPGSSEHTLLVQNLPAGQKLVFNNFTLNKSRWNGNSLTVNGVTHVNGTLTLTDGVLAIADGGLFSLRNPSPASLARTNGVVSSNSFAAQQASIVAQQTGVFARVCQPGGSYLFPVTRSGWNAPASGQPSTRPQHWAHYLPATITPNAGSATDEIRMRLTDVPRATYTASGFTYTGSGSGINREHVTNAWVVSHETPTANLSLDVTLQWTSSCPWNNYERHNSSPNADGSCNQTSADNALRFHRTRSFVVRSNGTTWQCMQPHGAAVANGPATWTRTATGLSKAADGLVGIFTVASATADVSQTNVTQNTPCRIINLNANGSDPMDVANRALLVSGATWVGSPAGGQWVFISGPSTPTILNPNNPVTQAVGATVDGNYVFEWRRFSAECGGTLASPIHAAQVTVAVTASGPSFAGATTTWTGNVSSDWNDCSNWSDGVPAIVTNVTIPSTAPHWPELPGDVTINRMVANAGAEIDLKNFKLTTRNRSNPSDATSIDLNFRNIFQTTTIRSTTGVANFNLTNNSGAHIIGAISQFRNCTFTGDINLVKVGDHDFIAQCGGNTFQERARISNNSRGEWRWGVTADGGRDVFEKDTWIEVKDDITGVRINTINAYWAGHNTTYPPVWTSGAFPTSVDYISPPYYVPGSGQPYTGTKVGFPNYPRNDTAPTNNPDPAVNAANFAANEAAMSANLADEQQSEANIVQARQNARDAASLAFTAVGNLTSDINAVSNSLANSPVPAVATPCSNSAAITAAQNALNTAIANATAFRDNTLQPAANAANASANNNDLATNPPGNSNALANAANTAVNDAQTHRANLWTALVNYLNAVNACINAYNASVGTFNGTRAASGYISMAYDSPDNEFKQNTYVRVQTTGRVHFTFGDNSSVRFGGATLDPNLRTEFHNSSSGGSGGAISISRRGTSVFNTTVLLRQSGDLTDEAGAVRIIHDNSAPNAALFNGDLIISQPGEGIIALGEQTSGASNAIILQGDLIIDRNLNDASVDNLHNGRLLFHQFTKNSNSPFTIITDATGRLVAERTNVFNGDAVFENRSMDNGQCFAYDFANSVQTFNGNVTLRNTTVSSIQVSGRGNVNFNGNLIIENTLDFLATTNDPNRCGVCVGQHWDDTAAGVTTLANTKTITIGAGGYATGTLLLRRFTQLGTGTPQNITLTAPQSEIALFNSTFQSSVTLEAPELRVRNSVFQPTAADGTTFTHLIATARGENTGGNIFHEPTTFELRGVRTPTFGPNWNIGENDKDDFLDETTFINSGGASHFNIANRNAGHVFARKVTFINGTNSATSTDVGGSRNILRVANEAGASVVFQGDVVVENRQSTEGEMVFARMGEITINGNLSLSNVNGSLLFGGGNRNNVADLNDIGQTTLQGTLTLQSGWQRGMLMLRGFTANNTAPITLELPPTNPGSNNIDNVLVIGKNSGGRSEFKASGFTAKARVLLLNGATYEGTDLLFEKLGAGANESRGDNDFRGVSRFVNQTANDFVMARFERDIFGNNVTFEEVGTGRINPAFRGVNQFRGNITVISPNNRNFEFSRDISATVPATGMVQITGTGTQNLINNISNATREISFRVLEMNQLTVSSLLVPNRNFTINALAVFKRGKIRLNAHVLTILNHNNPASVAVVGADLDDSYVQTNGTGTVRRTVAANGSSSVTVLFPVGNTTSYLAMGLRQSGGSAVTDVYNVRVRDGVHMSYDANNNPTGAAINRMFVNGAWIVTENVNGGTNAEAFLYWKPDDELPHFNRAQSSIVRYNRTTNKWRCTQPAGNFNGQTAAPLFWRISGGTAIEINDVGVFSLTSLVAFATTPITTCGSGSVTLNAVPFNDPANNAYSPFEGEWSFVSASDGSVITIPPSEKNKWNAVIPGLQSGVTYQFKWANVGLEGECNPGPSITVTVIVDPSTPIPGVVVRWTGNANDNDWFNCRNWDRFFIPNHTHDVEIRNVSAAIPAPGLSLTDPNGLPNYTTTGTNTYPIIANGTAFCRNLIIFSGASVTIAGGGEINVQQSVTNNQTFAVQANGKAIVGLDLTNNHTFTNAGEVRIGRSLLHNHTTPLTHTTGDVVFNGATNGIIGGAQPIQLNRVFVDKTGGLASTLTLTQPLTIHTRLQLTSGKMISSAANMLLLPLNATCNDGNPQSFVQGPIRRWVGDNEPFVFPTGRGGRWARISVTDLAGAGANDHFTAEYFIKNTLPNGPANMCAPGPNSLAPKLDHVSYVERWQLDRNAGGTVQAKVALYWENPAPNASDILQFNNLFVARYNGSCWENRGGNLFGSLASGRVETPARQTVFSPWTLGTDLDVPLQPLPVELVSLHAQLTNEGKGLITWITAWEKDAAYYEVQRSANGKDFEPIGQVAAKGNSNAKQTYQFTDVRPMTGVNYYRLRQVDTDGSFTFSPIVDLVVENGVEQWLEVYPNPTSGSDLQVRYLATQPRNAVMRIYDISGRLTWEQPVEVNKGFNKWAIDAVQDFAKGVYLLKIDDAPHAVRFVVH